MRNSTRSIGFYLHSIGLSNYLSELKCCFLSQRELKNKAFQTLHFESYNSYPKCFRLNASLANMDTFLFEFLRSRKEVFWKEVLYFHP